MVKSLKGVAPSARAPAPATQSPATVHPASILHDHRAPAPVWHCCPYAPVVFPGVPTQAIGAICAQRPC